VVLGGVALATGAAAREPLAAIGVASALASGAVLHACGCCRGRRSGPSRSASRAVLAAVEEAADAPSASMLR
jgi:hypothetical protein